MKKLIVLVSLCLICFTGFAKEFKEENFKVTYEIIYNSISLKEAYRLEQVFKKDFIDACEINIKVEKISCSSITLEFSSPIFDVTEYIDGNLTNGD